MILLQDHAIWYPGAFGGLSFRRAQSAACRKRAGSLGSANSAPDVGRKVYEGYERFTVSIKVPTLAITGYFQLKGPAFHADIANKIAAERPAAAEQARQIVAFERAQPSAESIRIPGATHHIFISTRDQVLAVINHFPPQLPTH